jgi:hypothetical protein
MCAPLFCPTDVQQALTMPEDWQPQALVTLGFPARPGKLKPRKASSDFVIFAPPTTDER